MRRFVVVPFICALTAFVISCGGSDKGTNTGNADEKVQEANASLATVLYALINSDSIDTPDEIDFTHPNQLYKEALTIDPNNTYANFGAGLTDLLILTVDDDVNDTFDTWKAFLDTASIFEPSGGKLGLNPTKPEELLTVSPAFLGVYAAGMFKMALTDPPKFSAIQNLIENKVFPRIDYAIARLTVASHDQNFLFEITPEMQGDEAEDPIQIDLTEIYAVLAQLNLIKSLCQMGISYNFDFVSYDSVGLLTAIDQSSSFLALRTGGAEDMAGAKTSFLAAVDHIEDAITFLKNETDDQTDDLIKVGDNFDEADLDTILAHLPEVRDGVNSTVDITQDFNGDGSDETVTFAFGNIFTNPLENLKEAFPSYDGFVGVDSTYDGRHFYYLWIRWDDTSFVDWVFPNPTFNGLMPEMTDTEFKSTFGIKLEDWKQEMRIFDLP